MSLKEPPINCTNCNKETSVKDAKRHWFFIIIERDRPQFCSIGCLINWAHGIEDGAITLERWRTK